MSEEAMELFETALEAYQDEPTHVGGVNEAAAVIAAAMAADKAEIARLEAENAALRERLAGSMPIAGGNPFKNATSGGISAKHWRHPMLTPKQIELPAITSIAQISEWLAAVGSGAWTWTRNSRCKYVDIKFDTRRGAYRILDRDGHQITFEQLTYQLRSEAPSHAG